MIEILAIEDIYRKPKLKKVVTSFDEFVLSHESIIVNRIRVGNTYSQEEFEELMTTMQYQYALEISLNYLSKAVKTEKELRQYLLKKDMLDEAIDRVITRLYELNYINDENYAKEYVLCYKQNKGKIRLKNELRLKGLSDEYIHNAFELIDDEYENVKQLAERFMRKRENNRKEIQRLTRHLLSRGYTYDLIKRVISEFGDLDEYN